MTVTTEVEKALREAAALFGEQAELLAGGGSLYDDSHLFSVLRALEALNPGAQLLRRYRAAERPRLAPRVLESETGRAVIQLVAEVTQWDGSSAELADALGIEPDPALLDNASWLSEGLAWLGAMPHVTGDRISLQRLAYFNYEVPREYRVRRGVRAELLRGPRVASSLLSGRWRAVGLDPEKCAYCLIGDFEEIEHFVPKKRGGTDDIENLFPSCIKCNRGAGGKHAKDPWAWLSRKHKSRVPFFRELLGD